MCSLVPWLSPAVSPCSGLRLAGSSRGNVRLQRSRGAGCPPSPARGTWRQPRGSSLHPAGDAVTSTFRTSGQSTAGRAGACVL